MKQIVPGAVVLLAALVAAGCGAEKMDAAWREAAGDGSISWSGVPFHREEGLEVGFANDEDHLYVCLYPVDPRVQMVLMRQGATVWIGDPERGFHITRRSDLEPEGAPGDGRPGGRMPADSAAAGSGRPPMDEEQRRELMMARAQGAPRDLEILDRDGTVHDVRSPSPAEPTDIRVESSEFLYYVLRVPLAGDAVAVGAGPGADVRVVVETPEFQVPDFMARRMASRRPGSGGGGFGSSNRRRRPSLSDLDPPAPIVLPAMVRLAEAGS